MRMMLIRFRAFEEDKGNDAADGSKCIDRFDANACKKSADHGTEHGGKRSEGLVNAENTSLDREGGFEGDGGDTIGPAEGSKCSGEDIETEECARALTESSKQKRYAEKG